MGYSPWGCKRVGHDLATKQEQCACNKNYHHGWASLVAQTVKNMGDLGSIPGLGRSPGEGQGNPLQYSCLENPHGQRSLADYSPWGFKGSDMTKRLRSAHIMGGIYLVICTINSSCEFPYFHQQCTALPVLLTPHPHSHLCLPSPSSINVQYKQGNTI